MEDKLLKILKIKIDAINRNIDNLNYLNGELERNDRDLEYIDGKLSLFAEGEILNFDNISRDDFNKILLMVNSSVSDIFKDKTCNYDGIIYIIEGIRKSISLQLTSNQTSAIMAFISGMKDKRENLLETISNLTESKNRLPETDLTILTNNLDKYNNIVSNFENGLYLTEIDEIGEALDFADVLIEEKSDIYEFILKYNASIYSKKENDEFSSTDEKEKDEFNFDLPEFNYDTVKVTNDLLDEKEKEGELESNDENSLDNIKFNLDNFKFDDEEINDSVKETDKLEKDDLPNIPDIDVSNLSDDLDNNDDSLNFDDNLNLDTENEALATEESHELNTIELEDIIKKIDAKLKEMELEDAKEENPVDIQKTTDEVANIQPNIEISPIEDNNLEKNAIEIPSIDQNATAINLDNSIDSSISLENNVEPSISLNELNNKYALREVNIQNTDLNDVDKMLQTLVDNNLLNAFQDNKNILELMISNYNNSNLVELISLVKDNLLVKSDEFNDVVSIMLEVMPILFTNTKVFNDFKENIEFYKEKNINIITIFDNYRELLIMSHDTLVNNYNRVISYGLEVNSDNVKYLLYGKNIIDKLDYYIEAIGYEKGFLGKEEHFDGVEYIKKNPYKLNGASRDMLLKLRYTSENNGKIYGNKPGILSGEITNPKVDIIQLTPDYLNSYFNGEYSAISKSDLKMQLENLSNIDMTLDGNLNLLDQNYKKDELRYQFDKFIISRIKTIRIYNYLKNTLSAKDALIIALTYNSVLKNEEYESIVNIVNNIVGGM